MIMKRRTSLLLLGMLLAACEPAADSVPPEQGGGAGAPPPTTAGAPPATERVEVADTFHGAEVREDYRWLEDWSNVKVKAWSNEQNAYARAHLDALPNLDVIRARVQEIYEAKVVSHHALSHVGGKYFAIKREPPKQQPFLVVLDSLDSAESRTLVDPNALDPEGGISIDWVRPSPDGSMVAVSMSKGGSESGDLYIFDVASGAQKGEVIQRVNGGTAGGAVAWWPDSKGFHYTRYPREGERAAEDLDFFVHVYSHELGTPESEDRYELGKDFPRIAEIDLDVHEPTGRVLVTVQEGDGGEFAHFLGAGHRKPGKSAKKSSWTQFSDFGDGVKQATFGDGDNLYVISRAEAPRGKLLRISAKKPDVARAKVIIPEGEDTIVSDFWGAPTVRVIGKSLFVTYQLGGPSEIRTFDLKGRPADSPTQLPVSSVGGMSEGPDSTLLFSNSSYVEPSAYHRFDPKTGKTTKTALATRAVVDFSGFEVKREFASSKDGTKVPMNILMAKGTKLDGSNPCVVYGYGGYGVNLTPGYRGSNAVLLEQGVIYVIANLRGGSEYGEDWHRAGNLTRKQNVFDDFSAVIRHLQAQGYTSPERTAIRGGSNGGLLMGATMVQHPELVKAVVSHVGIYDMLRVELSANGAFNIPEFGSVKVPDQFKALRAYSPYHNVVDGSAYPPVLFTTGANDPRVDPMQSRKMTARLQAATGGEVPVLLRTTSNAGHGSSTPLKERVEESAHVYAFIFDNLGVDYRPPN
jgi:prolyl oligopeptidase